MGRHSRRAPWQLGREPLLLSLIVLVVAGLSVLTVRTLAAAPPDPVVGCTGPTTTLSVGVDPAAVSWLTPLARSYTDEGRTVAGRCLAAQVRPLTLDQAQQALQPVPFPGAGAPPDVWIPESTTSLNLVRSRAESGRVLAVPAPPIASSPIVLAAPSDALLALARRAPDSQPRLADIVSLARDPRGWGRPGIERPDWGRVRLSTLNPGTTSLGASLVVAAVGSLTGTPAPDVGAKAFEAPEAREGLLGLVRSFQSAPATVAALLAPLNQVATTTEVVSKVGVLAAYEQDVWRYNGDLPAIVLRAGYPLDGQLAADYPFVVPAASWVDAADKAAAADFRDWLRSDAVQTRLGSYGLRRADGTAGPELLATTQALSPEPMPPVAPRAADGPVAARTAWRLLTRRVSLLGLFDVSGSMAEPVPGTGRSRLDIGPDRRAGLARLLRRPGLDRAVGVLPGAGRREGLPGAGPARAGRLAGERLPGPPGRLRRRLPGDGAADRDRALRHHPGRLPEHHRGVPAGVRQHARGDHRREDQDPGSITLPALLAELKQRYDPQKPVHIVTLAYGSGADGAALVQVAKATDGLQFAAPDPREIGQVFVTAVAALAG